MTTRIHSLIFTATVVVLAGAAQAAVISYSYGATPNQLFTDNLQGLPALGWNSNSPLLTDATSATAPTANNFGANTFTFDLGATWPYTRQLDQVILTTAGGDANRFQWVGNVQVGVGGTSYLNATYTTVATISLDQFNPALGGNSFFNPFNKGTATFGAKEVTNFQYLRLVDTRGGFTVRAVEVDALVSTIPEPASWALLSMGGLVLQRRRRA